MELILATTPDIPDLQQVCAESYHQIFADHWTDNGLELYLEQEFGTNRLTLELADPECEYHFIRQEGRTIGFTKINYQSSGLLSEMDNCELEKIYILPGFSGMGIGKQTMKELIKRIQLKGKEAVFVCVIDTNKNAIAFYEKLGFQFHSKTRLEIPNFKENLKGMYRMCLRLNQEERAHTV